MPNDYKINISVFKDGLRDNTYIFYGNKLKCKYGSHFRLNQEYGVMRFESPDVRINWMSMIVDTEHATSSTGTKISFEVTVFHTVESEKRIIYQEHLPYEQVVETVTKKFDEYFV